MTPKTILELLNWRWHDPDERQSVSSKPFDGIYHPGECDSHSLNHYLNPLTCVCLPFSVNNSLVLVGTGESPLCFIARHRKVGGGGWLQPSPLVLMGVGVLFLEQIYAWVGRFDLQSPDTVSAAGRRVDGDSLCVPGKPEVFSSSQHTPELLS